MPLTRPGRSVRLQNIIGNRFVESRPGTRSSTALTLVRDANCWIGRAASFRVPRSALRAYSRQYLARALVLSSLPSTGVPVKLKIILFAQCETLDVAT